MNAKDLRRYFLEFFQEKQHKLKPSSSVIPHGDKTLLFTNAGMNQFKDIFIGNVKPDDPRVTTVQKCIRAGGKHNDLDNVGYTTRHLTFFEMLGNFSFGDYFKEAAIEYAWELVADRLALPVDRLWVTVYREDDEARQLWRQISGLSEDRIVGLGEKDNYWSMGDVGPCGPCSEILFDRGEAFGEANVENGERFFEIWNLVFMQFDQEPGGRKDPLPHPSIDTGMGLERIAMVLQDVNSVFEIDLFRKLIARVEELTGTPYDSGPAGVPHRVLADHIRALVFSLADGAEPSNEGRGYVLRRILRRAARYGRKIHSAGPLLPLLIDDIVEEMSGTYPEIREHQDFITQVVKSEEERFGETLDTGIELFESTVAALREAKEETIPGAEVFKLYDTFGFPVDLVERMAEETGFKVDLHGFNVLMAEQRARSRGASTFETESVDDDFPVDELPETEFIGYGGTRGQGEIQVARERADVWRVVLSHTPFYAEAGGQVGDSGVIETDDFRLAVEDTRKEQGRFIHWCRLLEGDPGRIVPGQVVTAAVDGERRAAIERNHSATHLLHAALRRVAGTHVRQKGSLVSDERLRFDVTHYSAFTPAELEEVQEVVRYEILADTPIEVFETDYDDAVERGAMALFGEKYGDRVRVVKIGDFSIELCGGTHVRRTGEVGPFVLAGEGSVSSGVRRLEALTARASDQYHKKHHEIVSELSRLLKVAPDGAVERVKNMLEELRELKSRARQAGPADSANVQREDLGRALFVGAVLPDVSGKGLRESYDAFKKESQRLVAVLLGTAGGKLGVLVAVSPSLVKDGLDARELFKAAGDLLGARGGGRPEMVQAGGPLVEEEKLNGALEATLKAVKRKIGV